MVNENKIKPLFTEEQIQKAIALLAEKLNSEYGDEEVYLVCVLKGAVMFAVDLAKRLTMPVNMDFVRLSSYGSGTKSSGSVRVVDASLSDLNGKNVLIIEDIIDSGRTAKFIVEYLNDNFKMKSLKFCSLLDKKVRREVKVEADCYCFDVDDKFLVGYGLDYDGKFRNLPYIGYLET